MFNFDFKIDVQIKEAIIRVVVFFDLFDYPLSAYEIRHYLDDKAELADIIKALDELVLGDKSVIAGRDGFFFLSGREGILDIRRERYNYSLRKIKIARRFVRLFRLLPFIKMIALSNSIGSFNLRDGSDIDFFIITSERRLWLTRLYCAGIAKILNSRPTLNNKKDKICLSFYLSAENLNLDEFALHGGDPYFFYWRRNLFMLYNKDGYYEKFLAANNLSRSGNHDSGIAQRSSSTSFSVLDILEAIAKKIQFIIMSPSLKKAANNSLGVVINDKVLKLYLQDNRQAYSEKYGNKLRSILKEDD